MDKSSGRPTSDEMRGYLEDYLVLFNEYAAMIFERENQLDRDHFNAVESRLRRLEPRASQIVVEVLGNSRITFGSFGVRQRASTRDMFAAAIAGGNNAMPHNFRDFEPVVSAALERAIGSLDAGLWSPGTPPPTLVIHDDQLRSRCTDLLGAPGNYDRVIQEATRVLEDRIRSRVPHETLSRLIPNSGDQSGENLINSVFSVDKPTLSVSDDKVRRIAIRNILVGVVSYLRNPSHHHLDDQTEWSWAWSTVGLIDKLLTDIDGCDIRN